MAAKNILKLIVQTLKYILYGLFVVWLIVVLLGGIAFYYDITPHAKVSKVTIMGEKTWRFSATYYHHEYSEMQISPETFLKYAEKQGWKVAPITTPFKIRRYTTVMGGEYSENWDTVRTAGPEDEKPNSSFHFITEGYYFMQEGNFTLHVAYDLQNHTLYYYLRTCHGGGDEQEKINPLWEETKPQEPAVDSENGDGQP